MTLVMIITQLRMSLKRSRVGSCRGEEIKGGYGEAGKIGGKWAG